MALSNIAGWNENTAGSACGTSEKPAACGSACGASEKPSACGSACGASEKPAACGAADKAEDKPAACGSACGAGDNKIDIHESMIFLVWPKRESSGFTRLGDFFYRNSERLIKIKTTGVTEHETIFFFPMAYYR